MVPFHRPDLCDRIEATAERSRASRALELLLRTHCLCGGRHLRCYLVISAATSGRSHVGRIQLCGLLVTARQLPLPPLTYMQPTSPNHALQRTAPCVTAPASTTAFPPTMQVPRRTPLSLSLGSLGLHPRCFC